MEDKENARERFLRRSQRLVHENAVFIALFLVLNCTAQGWIFCRIYDFLSLTSYVFSMFFAAFCIVQIIELLHFALLKKAVKFLLLLSCGAVFLVESFTLYTYDALLGAGILNSIVETNSHEAAEFVVSHAGADEIAILPVAALLFWYLGKKILAYSRRAGSGRFLLYSLALGAAGTIELGTVHWSVLENGYFPMQRVAHAAGATVKNIRAYRELAAHLERNIVLTKNDGRIKNVVLVIGESCNRNHMELYGYYLPNTPRLSALDRQKKIFTFRDVISPHSTTVAVLSKLLTFCDYESDKEWYEYNNLVDVLNAAGYKTFWLSNQESSGIWGSVGQMLAQRSGEHAFTRIRDSCEDLGALDEELFPLIDRARTECGEKNFFVVHLMGQHDLYVKRYPYAFHKFTEDDIRLDLTPRGKLSVAQYDNSIYYNDFIVSEIIDKFKDDEALLIYISDHGEAVYDGTDFNGHVEENPNRHMIEVPCIFWVSDKLREAYPEKVFQIAKAVDRPYMSDDMIHTLLDLMDIHTKEYQMQKSVVNDCFDASRKRIFNELDYDREIKTGLVTD